MELITLATVIIGFLGLVLMNLQLNNQIRNETRGLFMELKMDIKELREDNKSIHARIDILSTRVDKVYSDLSAKIELLSTRLDATNSRIDRLTDAIYAQKAN